MSWNDDDRPFPFSKQLFKHLHLVIVNNDFPVATLRYEDNAVYYLEQLLIVAIAIDSLKHFNCLIFNFLSDLVFLRRTSCNLVFTTLLFNYCYHSLLNLLLNPRITNDDVFSHIKRYVSIQRQVTMSLLVKVLREIWVEVH